METTKTLTNHFIEIDKNISYIIGLFQTDGNIHLSDRNRGKATIELDYKDSDIIYKISEYIPYNYTIYERNRIKKFNNFNDKIYNTKSIGIRITEKGFRDFLISSGVPSGKKSNIIKPPLHLEKLSEIDYIRGLYDGDGSLGFTKKGFPFVSFVSASKEIIEYLCKYVNKLNNKPLKSMNLNKRDNIYNIVIVKEDAVNFCNTIYYYNCLSIERKYLKSLEIKKWKRPDTMKVMIQKNWNKEEDNYILTHSLIDSMKKLNRTEKSIKMRLFRLKNNFKY